LGQAFSRFFFVTSQDHEQELLTLIGVMYGELC